MHNTLVKTQSAALLGWLLLLLPTLALAAALPTVSRVKDINTTPGSSDPQYIVKVGNVTFFTATTPTTGRELWKTDGTAAGTVMVKDICPGSGSLSGYSDPNFTVVGNMLYFSANDAVHGSELWKSDGTAAGTVMVKDIYPGNAYNDSAHPYNFTAMGNVLYFAADDGVHGSELWRSDGTAAGTVLVKDIYAGSGGSFCDDFYCYYSNLTAVGNVLYFSANNGVTGFELWRSDGTAAGTVMVKDITPGTGGSLDYYSNFTAVGNVLYFAAYDGVNGSELWRSDGTTAGTFMVKDIRAGSDSALGYAYYPYFTAVGNMLYFRADDGVHGSELWKSDGTESGTVLVKDIYTGSDSSLCYDDSCYNYDPSFTAIGSTLYFQADDGVHGRELWKSNGSTAGTVLVKDIQAGSGSPFCIYYSYYICYDPNFPAAVPSERHNS